VNLSRLVAYPLWNSYQSKRRIAVLTFAVNAFFSERGFFALRWKKMLAIDYFQNKYPFSLLQLLKS
jgi:hypothetical protein